PASPLDTTTLPPVPEAACPADNRTSPPESAPSPPSRFKVPPTVDDAPTATSTVDGLTPRPDMILIVPPTPVELAPPERATLPEAPAPPSTITEPAKLVGLDPERTVTSELEPPLSPLAIKTEPVDSLFNATLP
ncbi:hypothetical protein AeRB84_009256, partial [Aphanomyces euteiches]